MTAMVLLSTWMESQVEFWLPVKSHEGYDISNCGRVRSWRIVKPLPNRGGTIPARRKTALLLKPRANKHGYIIIGLSRTNKGVRGKGRSEPVHRLVAQAFISNPENLPCVNHITGLKVDNRMDALEWSTHKQNSKHAWATGLQHRDRYAFAMKMVEARREFREVPDVLVRMIRNMLRDGISQGQIRRWSGLKAVMIQSIAVGRTYKDVA